LFTLDRNFRTRNPTTLSKVSKDSDRSLVSNKNFSEILPSNGLGSGPGEVGQGCLKSSIYDVTHKKLTTLDQILSLRTTRLAEPFESLNSSLLLSAPELRLRKAACDSFFWPRNPRSLPEAKVSKWELIDGD